MSLREPASPPASPAEYVEKPLKLVLKVGGSEVTELSTGSSGHDSSLFDDKSEHDKHRDRKRKKRKKGEKQVPGEEKGRKRRRVKVRAAAPGGPPLPPDGTGLSGALAPPLKAALWGGGAGPSGNTGRPAGCFVRPLRAHLRGLRTWWAGPVGVVFCGRVGGASACGGRGLRAAASGIRPGPHRWLRSLGAPGAAAVLRARPPPFQTALASVEEKIGWRCEVFRGSDARREDEHFPSRG